jgi:hypothetical protein
MEGRALLALYAFRLAVSCMTRVDFVQALTPPGQRHMPLKEKQQNNTQS